MRDHKPDPMPIFKERLQEVALRLRSQNEIRRGTPPDANQPDRVKQEREPLPLKGDVATDVLIISALLDEDKAIRRFALNKDELATEEQRDGQYFKFYNVSRGEKQIRVTTTCFSEMGMTTAAILTTRAMISIKPQIIVMGGICAGRKDKTKIGDVVIATDMFNYDQGKITPEGLVPDYPFVSMRWDLKNLVNSIASLSDIGLTIERQWQMDSGRPSSRLDVHVGPFASGGGVVADEAIFDEITEHQRKTLALDMEVYGAAKAAHYDKSVGFVAIKSVSDYADESKSQSDHQYDQYREYCCFTSALAIRMFLEKVTLN